MLGNYYISMKCALYKQSLINDFEGSGEVPPKRNGRIYQTLHAHEAVWPQRHHPFIQSQQSYSARQERAHRRCRIFQPSGRIHYFVQYIRDNRTKSHLGVRTTPRISAFSQNLQPVKNAYFSCRTTSKALELSWLWTGPWVSLIPCWLFSQ